MNGSLALLAAVLAVPALTGCGSGLNAQTYQQRTTADSTNAVQGDIAIRNLAVAAPSSGLSIPVGGNAQVFGSFVNNSDVADVLVSASSPAATKTSFLLGLKGQSSIAVPGLQLSDPTASIVLYGLTQPLVSGTYVELTLDFQRAGRTTLQVPVRAVTPGDRVAPSVNPFQKPEGGEG